MDENMIKTYSEINCLLDYFPQSYIEKLPSEFLKLIRNNCSSKYFIKINPTESIDKQNISKETKNMLVVLKYNYWSSESERNHIKKKLQENEKIYLNEQREKYNPDNLFITKQNKEIKGNEETKALIEYKEKNFIQRIFDKIKSIFKRK